MTQMIAEVDEEVWDNFAGGGGGSEGMEQALNRPVDHAINHAWDALGMHRINHSRTVHHCEDIFDVVIEKILRGRRIGAGWFSPDCKHFSKAKGGKPLSKKIRGLAFIMLRYAAVRTRVMYMENVEEIQTWGPLLHNPNHKKDCVCGKPCGKADPAHKGRTWDAFLMALGPGLPPNHPDIPEILEVLDNSITKEQLICGFGYNLETREIRACDFGTPTIRNRLYMIARCDGMPIVWPEPTHISPKLENPKNLKPWRIIAECIDWNIPCNSIFLTKRQAKVTRCKRPLAKATLRRIAIGVDRYVLKAERPFLVSLTHQGGDRVESVDEPGKTITGAHRGEKAVVDADIVPFITEHANASNQRNLPMDEPSRTLCAEVKGGHFAVVAASIAREFGESVGQPATQPAPTVMPGGQGKTSLISANLMQKGHLKSNSAMVKGADEPMRTQATRAEHAVVAAHLTKFNTGSIGSEADQPAPTITAGTHSPETHGGAASTLGVVAANLVKLRGDVESHNAGIKPDEPMHTISAGGLHHAVSAAYLAQHNAGFNTTPGHPATDPVTTISSKGSQQQVVAGSLAAYFGSEKDGQAVDESLRTISTKPRFGFALSEAVAPPMTEAQVIGAHRVAKFLRSHGVEFKGEFATVGSFVVVDIGMRMLTPRELFRAQGFPEAYIIDRAWVVNPKTGEIVEVHLTKEQQIRMCGNSVCPPVARALVAANNPELVMRERVLQAV